VRDRFIERAPRRLRIAIRSPLSIAALAQVSLVGLMVRDCNFSGTDALDRS
jgi:hypothetical protein